MSLTKAICTEQTVFCRSDIGYSDNCLYWTRFTASSKKRAAESAIKRGWVFSKVWHCPTCSKKITKETK